MRGHSPVMTSLLPPTTESPAAAPAAAPENVLYFAIGSMCNPQSLALRNLRPAASWPAEILDHELVFDLGPSGMADAIPRTGASFHGVLHEMAPADMASLDRLEASYRRMPARVRRYDGKEVGASVYTTQRNEAGRPVDGASGKADIMGPPGLTTQRYLEIIAAGCRHFGVSEAYVAALLARPCTPRTPPSEFVSFVPAAGGEPEAWDEARLAAAPAGAEDSITVALDGRVVRVSGGWSGVLKRQGAHGTHLEPRIAAILYDPLYGAPARVEDFTRTHSAYLVDMLLRMWAKQPSVKVEVLGVIPQRYKGNESAAGGAAGGAGASAGEGAS